MAQEIEFQGEVHEFPDDWDNEKIGASLQMYLDGQPVPKREPAQDPITLETLSLEHTRPDDGAASFEDLGESGVGLTNLNDAQEEFRSRIQTIETGGLDSPWTRTKVTGSGSTAYGTYQITRGLVRGYLSNNASMFDEEEQAAMQELDRRQSIAIKIGGSDRRKYERGGANYPLAKRWARDFGFNTVDEFLDAFDYGGDYGLADDIDWQLQYENFARKMLNDHLKQTGGDALEAASVWHGGTNWKRSKKHRKQTDTYRKKYEALGNANE